MKYSMEPKPTNSAFNDEQWQAIQTKGKNILVSASAGSGKTTVLIERIFTHIRKGFCDVNELLVVTFTEAAANEMKERMERRLKEAVNETLDSEEQRRLIEQLSLLPQANIQTLHSFCLEVIQNFFYLIDFNPNFSLVTDQTQVQLIYQDVWDEMVASIFDETKETDEVTPPIYESLLTRYGNIRSDEALYNIIVDLYLFARSQPEPSLWLDKAGEVSGSFANLKDSTLYQQTIKSVILSNAMQAIKLLESAVSMMHSISDEAIGKYEPTLDNDLAQAKAIYQYAMEDDFELLFAEAAALTFGSWKPNKKTSEDYEIVAEMKAMRDDAKDLVNKNIKNLFTYDLTLTMTIENQVTEIITDLSKLAKLFMNRLAEHKTGINVIDYNDLEHLALQILAPVNKDKNGRDLSSAALYYQSKFKEIMIDEYQDINDIQNNILYYLSHETSKLEDNMFMVGDVKQSIYGFRMAEPSLFLTRYMNYANSDKSELIILDKNYRSRDEILQFTNFIFERVMNTDFGEMNYGKAESLTTGNHSFVPEAKHPEFNIQLKLYEKENQDDSDASSESELSDEVALVDTSLEAESHLIAQDVIQKVESGYLIYDKKLKERRPVTFADFVILTPTRKPFLIAQRIMETYNVPIYAQKVENYFQRQEVQLMLALLKLIDNPLQDIPLVAVLRSYFVQLSDEELSKIRISSPSGLFYEAVLDYLNNNKESETDILTRLKRFMEQLDHWQELSKRITLVDLIWTIYQETSFLDYVAGLSNGVQREANLHALYQKAVDFEQSQYKGVFGFIRYIEKIMQQQNDLAEPVLLDSEQNFVRLMTVHASKGLEFPIVYLMNTAKKFNLQDARTKPYIASKHYGIGSDYYDIENWLKFESFTKQAFKIEKENMLKAEEMRKLYVALTRCEQKLIIVGTVKSQEQWMDKQEETQSKLEDGAKLIPLQERQSATSWLDWIRQALAIPTNESSVADFDVTQVDIEFIDLKELTEIQARYQVATNYSRKVDLAKEVEKLEINDLQDKSVYNHLNTLFNYDYHFSMATRTSSYQSVSELKRLYEEPRIEKIEYFSDRREAIVNDSLENVTAEYESIQGIRYTEDTFQAPKFVDDMSAQPNYADIGSATHFLLQQLDFSELVDLNSAEIEERVIRASTDLVEGGHLSKRLADLINYDSVLNFIDSDLGQFTIKNAEKVKKEQAFSYLTPALKLFEKNVSPENIQELSEDQLLIHGVIDNFMEFDDEIVIYDYKTDRYKPYANATRDEQIAQVIDKYRFQISLYSKALTIAFNKPVRQAYIVLLDFDLSVAVEEMYEF